MIAYNATDDPPSCTCRYVPLPPDGGASCPSYIRVPPYCAQNVSDPPSEPRCPVHGYL